MAPIRAICKGVSRAQEKERKPTVPVEFSKLPLLHEFVTKFVSIPRISIVGAPASRFLLARSDQPDLLLRAFS
jgi:hypothetical protein